jgi:hypothetical protein
VCFLRSAKTIGTVHFTPVRGGTGFFVMRQSEKVPFTFHIYAVTNRHVVDEGCTNIRVNSSATSVMYWEYDVSDWVFSNTDDLAVLDVTDQIDFSQEYGLSKQRPIEFFSERFFVSEKFKSDHNIGPGDDTIMLGLLTHHGGGKINLPVARFGNIAASANDLTPVQLGLRDRFVHG